jgi:hypothetical protein
MATCNFAAGCTFALCVGTPVACEQLTAAQCAQTTGCSAL